MEPLSRFQNSWRNLEQLVIKRLLVNLNRRTVAVAEGATPSDLNGGFSQAIVFT